MKEWKKGEEDEKKEEGEYEIEIRYWSMELKGETVVKILIPMFLVFEWEWVKETECTLIKWFFQMQKDLVFWSLS